MNEAVVNPTDGGAGAAAPEGCNGIRTSMGVEGVVPLVGGCPGAERGVSPLAIEVSKEDGSVMRRAKMVSGMSKDLCLNIRKWGGRVTSGGEIAREAIGKAEGGRLRRGGVQVGGPVGPSDEDGPSE